MAENSPSSDGDSNSVSLRIYGTASDVMFVNE